MDFRYGAAKTICGRFFKILFGLESNCIREYFMHFQRSPVVTPSGQPAAHGPAGGQQKAWGQSRVVDVFRRSGAGLGISIVGT